jgi:very-short-patch-repair endonuclease
MTVDDVAVEDVVARQAGVISLAQAVACGMSAASVRRRARSGAWRGVGPRVFLVGGHRLTDEARVRVAWLGADGSGPAVVTGHAAAYWHGMLDTPPRQIGITVPRRMHLRAPPGTVLLRRDLAAEDVRWVRDLRVAAPAFAALETALVVGSTFLDRVLQRHVPFPDIYRCYCRNLGRRGSSGAAGLLAAAADRADSDAERRLVTLLRAAGISGWVLGHRLGPWTIDLAFPDVRVAIEVDGWAWHVEVDRFRNDRRKGNAIVRAGWTLLRFTWHDLHTRPYEVLAEIREVVAAAA